MNFVVPVFSLEAFATVSLACLVGLDFIDRLRSVDSSKYRTGWLVVGGWMLGGGMWVAHFLWSAGAYADFNSDNAPPILGGLFISFLAALLVLRIAISPMNKTIATLGTVFLIFGSFYLSTFLWVSNTQYSGFDFTDNALALGLLAAGTIATWVAKKRRISAVFSISHKLISTLGVVAISYSSFRLTTNLLGVPFNELRGDRVSLDPIFINISILLVAAWVVSIFERRFTRTLLKHQEAEEALRVSQKNARAIMDTAFDPFVSTMDDGTITEWNEQAEHTFGWRREEAIGKNWEGLIFCDEAVVRKIDQLKQSISACGPTSDHRLDLEARHKNGRRFPVELTTWPTKVNGLTVYNAFLHDISDRRQNARRISAQTNAASALLRASSLEDAGPALLREICHSLGWSLGAIWLHNMHKSELRCEFFWPEEGAYPIFEEVTKANTLSLGIGLPGRVFMSGAPLWIQDITQDSWFSRARAAELDGLHGAFAFPICGPGGILGVVEFFSDHLQEPDEDLLEMMDTIGTLLGSFIEAQKSLLDLARERAFLSGLLENLSDGIVACNKDGDLTVFNRATREFHNMTEAVSTPEEWAEHYRLFMPDGETPMLKHQIPLYRALKGETVREAELVVLPDDGPRKTLLCNGQPLVGPSGELLGAVVAMHDITEKKLAEQKLKNLAHFDALTTLPNRALLYERLGEAIEQSKIDGSGFCIMFLDLDRFKEVNDTLGHAAGDDLLSQVAIRLVKCLRDHDTVGRLGGDEFAVIIPGGLSEESIANVASKIKHSIRQPFYLGGKEVNVSTSIGITFFPDDTTEVETLIKFADTAMYAAKEAGKDQYRFYTPEMNEKTLAKMELEFSLKQAIEQELFSLYYQPKISLSTGSVTGLEALLRWDHPSRGLLLPNQFVGVLEETGMINAVGEWVLETACKQIQAWIAEGIEPPRVAVNVSAKQFVPGNRQRKGEVATEYALESSIFSLVKQYPEAIKHLEIEITESAIMSRSSHSIELLENLKALGVSIAIDDFGTGYSSLSYLKRLPIDSIKIDQEFVRDVVVDNDDAAIISAIISMSHSLGLRVIAEGVESKDQLDMLKKLGCDEAQGYLISRPLAFADLTDFLRSSGHFSIVDVYSNIT